MKVFTFFALVTSLVLFESVSFALDVEHAAIAWPRNPSGIPVSTGSAYMEPSRRAAAQRAMDECDRYNTDGRCVIMAIGTGCVAHVKGRKHHGFASGYRHRKGDKIISGEEHAIQLAREICRVNELKDGYSGYCEVVDSFCAWSAPCNNRKPAKQFIRKINFQQEMRMLDIIDRLNPNYLRTETGISVRTAKYLRDNRSPNSLESFVEATPICVDELQAILRYSHRRSFR